MCDIGVLRLPAQPVNNVDAWLLQSYAINNDVMQNYVCAVALWKKVKNRYCYKGRHAYDSLDAAKKACVQEPSCTGILDNGCDGSGKFNFCDGKGLYSSSSPTCVYKVNRAALKKCTCANGTPAVGDR